MAELTEEQKDIIVRALARRRQPADIIKALRVEFGIEVVTRQITAYDPTKRSFEASDQWRAVYEEEKERYLKGMEEIPIFHQAYRLNIMQENLDKQLASGNTVAANNTLRQAAEEVGGAMTNQRDVRVTKSDVASMTPDERRAAFAEEVRKAVEKMDSDPKGTTPAPSATQ